MTMMSKKDWPWFSQAECKPIESTSLVSPKEVSVIQRSRRQAGGGPAGEEPDKSGSICTKPTNQDSSIEPVEEDQHAADGGAGEEVTETHHRRLSHILSRDAPEENKEFDLCPDL